MHHVKIHQALSLVPVLLDSLETVNLVPMMMSVQMKRITVMIMPLVQMCPDHFHAPVTRDTQEPVKSERVLTMTSVRMRPTIAMPMPHVPTLLAPSLAPVIRRLRAMASHAPVQLDISTIHISPCV